ncbi:hypothetical protein ACX27_27005 [Nostoc piscinale CENA21]|uniref:Uncharacterized protein n=1 Tax=Nostoc piscinale CENA21 TaxID=224013 RepID=A0A0M4T5S2_9NOSO|nr:hypothetical protein ACX27_27005 [Nostoc piscinale CENA21]
MRAIVRIVPQKDTAKAKSKVKSKKVKEISLLTFDFYLLPFLVRVQRCGKSAPATSRGVGSVNPGWEQGQRNYGWSFTSSAYESR